MRPPPASGRSWPVAILINCSGPHGPDRSTRATNSGLETAASERKPALSSRFTGFPRAAKAGTGGDLFALVASFGASWQRRNRI